MIVRYEILLAEIRLFRSEDSLFSLLLIADSDSETSETIVAVFLAKSKSFEISLRTMKLSVQFLPFLTFSRFFQNYSFLRIIRWETEWCAIDELLRAIILELGLNSVSKLFFFFCEVGPNSWTQARWPITLYLSFKFIGLFRSPAPLPRAMIPLSFASFICSGSILANPNVCILTFSNTRHLHKMCTDVFFSAPHLLHEGVFALLILCSTYSSLICPVRSPTNNLQRFPSSLLMNWKPISWSL